MVLPNKLKRQIYKRRIVSFWQDFSHNKIGFMGLLIIIFFVTLAVLAPISTPYQPATQLYRPPKVATRFALPQWLTIVPAYSDYNPTIKIDYNLQEARLINFTGPIKVNLKNQTFTFLPEKTRSRASVTLFVGNLTYTYASPPEFSIRIAYRMSFNRSSMKLYVIIRNYTANHMWETYLENPNEANMPITTFIPSPRQKLNETSADLEVQAFSHKIIMALFGWLTGRHGNITSIFTLNPAEILFSAKGTYGIYLRIEFQDIWPYEGAYARLKLEKVGFSIWGRVHGFLGTNFQGYDAWTELAYGARVSLLVGILAATLATSIGILYGVISGYVGGFVDEFLMRVVDVLLCLPVLPILLVMIRYYRPNVYFVVILIAIFGWQGLSRVIRSRVLSLKEMAFIESARATGASDSYLIFRHLVPNVLPIATPALILSVPGAILTEAALSFLGFGDPNAPTWGRMLYHAYQLGAFSSGAWWLWLPPGLAITVLCLGFVFIGHAVDEIVNPRLRRRR